MSADGTCEARSRPVGLQRVRRRVVLLALLSTACSLPQQVDGPSPGADVGRSVAVAERTGAPAPSAAVVPRNASYLATRLGQDVFAPAEVAIVGHVLSVASVGLATGVLRVRVAERLVGDLRPGQDLTVLGFASDFAEGSVEILFLRRFRGGPRYEVTQRIEGRDPDFRAKLEVARRTARLRDILAAPERDSATLQFVLDCLRDDDRWTRRYGTAELGWIASTRADLFTDVRRQMLEAIARETTDPDVRAGVESVTITLERRSLSLPGSPGQESSSP